MEFAENGSAFDIIRTKPDELTIERVFSAITDVAKGMAYLHGRKPAIIHRDLKTANILINKAWIAKVTLKSFN